MISQLDRRCDIEDTTHVNWRLCCISYFSLAMFSTILLPSFTLSSSPQAEIER